MKSRSLYEKMIAACFLLVAIPTLLAAQSIEDRTFFRLSSLVGLNRGESASLNVTNVSREVKEVHFYFIDADGRLLKSSSARVLPGQSVSLMLSHSELRDPAGRMQIRGAVRFADPPSPDLDPPSPDADPPQPDLVMSSLEIYDEVTGKTSFGLLLPAVKGANLYFPFIDAGVIKQ